MLIIKVRESCPLQARKQWLEEVFNDSMKSYYTTLNPIKVKIDSHKLVDYVINRW
jgi:hypothetical protein